MKIEMTVKESELQRITKENLTFGLVSLGA